MLKNIIFIIELFVFVLALLIIALMYGITLSNLSYENINISQLYIKYDKNLILKSKDLTLNDKNNNIYKFDLDINLDMKNDKYYIQIDKLNYKNSKLILKSDLVLGQKQIDDILDLKINNIELKNFKLNFDKNIAPIETKSTFITYKNDNLYFKLKNPQLNKIKLDKSSVILKNITKNMVLDLDLYSKGQINTKLKNIITYYGVDLPIKQYYGSNETHVKVSVPFNKEKVKVFVDVKSKNTKILYDDKLVIAKELFVKYYDNTLDIKSNDGQIYIIDRNITFDKLNLIYKNKIFDIDVNKGKTQFVDRNVSFDNLKINIKNNLVNVITNVVSDNYDVNISINNNTNLKTNFSYGTAHINNITIDKLFTYKNKNIDYSLTKENNNKFIFEIKKLLLTYKFDGNSTHDIQIDKANNILNNIKILENNNDKKITKIKIITKDNFKSNIVDIDNIDINIIKSKYNDFINIDKKYNIVDYPNITTYITNSILGYDKRYIYAKNANVKLNKDKISVKVQDQDNISILKFTMVGRQLSLQSNKLSSNFVNRILKKSKFRDGFISIEAVGNTEHLDGQIKFHHTTLKDVRAVNNLITFINTTPAAFNPLLTLPTLFRLGQVNFDLDGYYIVDGKSNFTYNIKDEILKINSLSTRGKMADFKGNVEANFKTQKIKANLQVIFLKDYSKIIKVIPLLGYIIVGKDGNFLTNISLKGSFEKQEFETHMLDDTTNGILNIIKRTISLPILPFVNEEDILK